MHDQPRTTRLVAAGLTALVVAGLVVAWATPAAAVLPSFTGPTTVPVTTNATRTLAGAGAPQVVDPDSPGTMALQLAIGGPSVGRPTFTLDGTDKLEVVGSVVRSRAAGVSGTRAAINAVLDGMRIEGGAPSLDYTLTLVADETPGAAGGTTTRTITIEQRGTNPVNVMGTTFTVGTRADLTLAGPTAPRVSDADSPVLEIELNISTSAGIPEAEWPTFALDGTAGLTVTQGSITGSRFVEVNGTIAALNAALDGMVVTGGTEAGAFRLVAETDDVVGRGAGDGDLADTDLTGFTVTSERPDVAGLRSISLGTSSSRVLAPFTVGDPDSPVLDVQLTMARRAPDTTSTRPTFSLPTTAGLGVTGASTASTTVRLLGPIAALNAALAGVVVTAPAATGAYDLVVRADDGQAVGTDGNTVFGQAGITVTGELPTASAGPDVTIGAGATRGLGADAPSVGDGDDDGVEATLEVQRTGTDTTSVRPTFTLAATGLAVTSGSATASSAVTVAGAPGAIDAALAGMALTGGPAAGTYRLALRVDEVVGAGVGRVATDTATITVTAGAPTVAGLGNMAFDTVTTVALGDVVPPQVADADSPVVDLDVRLLPGVGATGVGTRFELTGTAGLSVTSGATTASTQVGVTGSLAAVNAALAALELTTPMAAETFRLVITVDDVPGAATGRSASLTISGSVLARLPRSIAGAPLALASLTSSPPLVGSAAPRVSDPDSPVVDVEVGVVSRTALRSEHQPTFTLDAAGSGITVVAGGVTASRRVVLRGSPTAINAMLDGMVVRAGPTAGPFGILVEVDDDGPGGESPASAVTDVTVTDVVPTVAVPGAAVPARPGQVVPAPVLVTDDDSGELEARVRVLGTAASRPQVRITPPAGLVVDAGPATGTTDLQVHGPAAAVIAALGGLRVVAGTATGTSTVEVAVDDARPEVGNAVTRTFTVVVTVPPPPFAPFASAGAMVDRLHLDLLGRAPTTAERSAAVDGLGAGTLTAAGLVARLRATADNTANVDPVTRLYRAYFLRIPDQAGLDFWIARRRAGQSLNQISQSFAQSPEFRTLYGSLTNRGFVERIYVNVLGRPGEADGVAFWTSQLDSGARTRGQVMTGFSESSEYRGQQRAEVDVSVAYIALLGRRPTTAEHDGAVAAIEGGSLTLAALHAAILGGEEYRDLVT